MPNNDDVFYCPICDHVMDYDPSAVLDLSCPECGAEGYVDFANGRTNIHIAENYSVEDIYDDPDGNMPECCKSCGCGAYPDCMTSCSIFDD